MSCVYTIVLASVTAPTVVVQTGPDLMTAPAVVVQHGPGLMIGDGECTTSDQCVSLHPNMSMPVCVNQTGGFYSQCIDCEVKAFQLSCTFWTDALLKPAEAACDMKCTGSAPTNLTCTTDDDCADAKSVCVVQDDGQYAQCVSCDPVKFEQDCISWDPKKLLPKAEAKCGVNCTGSGGLACKTDGDCTDPSKPTCVVQADGFYAQCITCAADQFKLACKSWDPQQFLPAAEAKCTEKCD